MDEEWKEIRDRFMLIDMILLRLPDDIANIIRRDVIEMYVEEWR